jgi:Methyltransferase domain
MFTLLWWFAISLASACVTNALVDRLISNMRYLVKSTSNGARQDGDFFAVTGTIANSSVEKLRDFAAVAQLIETNGTICDLGPTTPQMAVIVLTSNPTAQYIGFAFNLNTQKRLSQSINPVAYTNRMRYTVGQTSQDLRQFKHANPLFYCNLWIINDGAKRLTIDFDAVHALASLDSYVLLNKVTKSLLVDGIWKQQQDNRQLDSIKCVESLQEFAEGNFGWCLGRWLPHTKNAPTARALAVALHRARQCSELKFETKSEQKIARKPRGCVLTSFTIGTPDPQRKVFVQPTAAYIQAFTASVNRLSLCAIIMHDGIDTTLIKAWTSSTIKFIRSARTLYDGNADRFLMYKELLGNWPSDLAATPEYIVLTDLDVFFQHDPFVFAAEQPTVDLFLSMDTGTHGSNAWMRRVNTNCNQIAAADRTIDNAGLWGGKRQAVVDVLTCMVENFRGLYSSVGCNMAIFNTCVRKVEPNYSVYRGQKWSNPFRQQCDNALYVAIHNKCTPVRGCLAVSKNGVKRISCTKLAQSTLPRVEDSRAIKIENAKRAIAERDGWMTLEYGRAVHPKPIFSVVHPYYACTQSFRKSPSVTAAKDGGKWICGLERLAQQSACIVYSIGSKGQYDFENAVAAMAPNCKIFTFDCTFKPSTVPPAVTAYYSWCLDVENRLVDHLGETRTLQNLSTTLGHKHIDLLKIDVEGYEWAVIDSIGDWRVSIGQLLMEMHPQKHPKESLSASRLNLYFHKLEKHGLFLSSLEPVCPNCINAHETVWLNTTLW